MSKIPFTPKPNGPNTSPEELSFEEVARRVSGKFEDAIVATASSDRYRYFTTAWRERVGHRLGFFSIATSMLQMRRRNAEIIEFGVPIERNDASMPISMLGKAVGAEFFLVTYMATRGGEKTLQVTPEVYEQRFLDSRKPPIADLGQKLLDFKVVPMVEVDPGNNLVFGPSPEGA